MPPGQNEITHNSIVKDVLESPKLKEFFENHIFGEKALTFDFKWLRVRVTYKNFVKKFHQLEFIYHKFV